MTKDEFQQQQPVIYQILKNTMENQTLAHAYLFHGSTSSALKEVAYFFAQSLLCQEDTFACTTCNTCRRISHNEYTDCIWIDGSEGSIKKDQILKLQQAFAKTCLETGGKKIYIIQNIENATLEASNSLLKFLEEPSKDIIAILLSEKLDLVLPTIQSRCQILPLKAYTQNDCFLKYKSILDPIDAYLLSHLIQSMKDIEEVNDTDDYQHARYLFRLFINKLVEAPWKALFVIQLEGNHKKMDKQGALYFIRMLLVFFKDCCYGKIFCEDPWYQSKIKEMRQKKIDTIAILRTLMEAEDALLRPVNIALLLDQVVFEIKEAMKDETTRNERRA